MMTDDQIPSTTTPDNAEQPSAEVSAEQTASVDEPTHAPTPAPAPEPQPAQSDEDLFAAEMAKLESGTTQTGSEAYRKLTKGDRIEATVIQVEHDRVFVDLGTKTEGVVPLAELSVEPLDSAHGHVSIGDRIHVVVLRPEGGGGENNPIVSKKRADFEEVWNLIVAKHESGEIVHAQVVNRVKGGLEVDLGVRGFVPATHVGNGKLRNIEKYVGQTMEFKIIEVDRDRKKVVLSNRQAEDERREKAKGEIFDRVKPGDILEGTVRRLTDYGAFIDLGGIDGLLHISEMSWMRINHPKEVLKEGQELKVMVLRLDEGTGKISLGLRQVLPDPWNLIKENYKIGQRVACTISRLVQTGCFVKLPEGAEAFLPVSEISNRRIGKPSDVLTEGQDVEVAIIDLRPDERRMVLSMRSAGTAIDPPAEYEPSGQMMPEFDDDRGRGKTGKTGGKKKKGRGGRHDDDEYDVPFSGRVSTGGATIGERLGMLKGLLRPDDEDGDETEETTETPADTDSE